MLGVSQDKATLWIDCEQVEGIHGTYDAPLQPRGPVDATNGLLSVARMTESNWTVPVS